MNNIGFAQVNRLSAVGLPPTVVATAAAGSTATITELSGNDLGIFFRVTPNGAGIVAGSIVTITFSQPRANARYLVFVSPHSSAARSLTGKIGPTNRTTASVDLSTPTALVSGSAYQLGVLILDMP